MPFKSPYADVEIPDVSVYDFLFAGLTDDEAMQSLRAAPRRRPR